MGNDDANVVAGNDWTGMFASAGDTLVNVFTGFKDATRASPTGVLKPQIPNPAPGLFGAFPQAQVNQQGNAPGLLSTLGLGGIAGGGIGTIVLIGLALLFFLKR